LLSPTESRQEENDNIKLMSNNTNPEPKAISRSKGISIKMSDKETEPATPSWGWIRCLSPHLKPGGKAGALILAVGFAAITISSVTGVSQIILAISVLMAVVSE
jgi:hypothetical protein